VPDEPAIDDLLARLERQRLDADRLYNDALTAVDRAIQSVPALPGAPPAYDASRLHDINAAWDILPGGPPPLDRSIKGRLRAMIWRLVGPPLDTQRRFNAALVDHLNRNAQAHHERSQALQALLSSVQAELAQLVQFQSLLVQFLQTITVYVDSKDRSLGGREIHDRLALNEHRLLALKRELERAALPPSAGAQDGTPAAAPASAFGGTIDSLTYVAFEDRFRGAREEIQRRVHDYLPILSAASDVVDIGCGRGELLAALNERGITARGVDISPAMVELCRSRGLNAEQGDAVSYLERQAPHSVGGLVAIQVVEHFSPAYLLRFLESAFAAMRPGSPLVLETINAACWMAFFETYIRDLTHEQPLHPDTLKHLVQASGFVQVDVQFREPVRAVDRLDTVPAVVGADPTLTKVVAALNAHADKLNARLFSAMDYVVVARR
jgi:O-antigen chain-terminating methyltransferase